MTPESLSHAMTYLTERGATFALNFAMALAMLLLGWWIIRLMTAGLQKAITLGGRKRTLFSDFATSVFSKACWAVLIVMALGRLGVNVGPLIAGLGVTGFILGFAFQETLGNFASGMMIALNEPFKVGDFVEVAGFSGSVISVNMMATILATADNKKIVVPNKSAWGSPITNYSSLGKRRVDLTVVLAEPKMRVAPASFDESAVTLVVRPWVKASDYWDVHAAAIQAIHKAFEREGISIPFPQLDVHLDGKPL